MWYLQYPLLPSSFLWYAPCANMWKKGKKRENKCDACNTVTALIISPVRSFLYVTKCGKKNVKKGKTNVILAISVTALVISSVRSFQYEILHTTLPRCVWDAGGNRKSVPICASEVYPCMCVCVYVCVCVSIVCNIRYCLCHLFGKLFSICDTSYYSTLYKTQGEFVSLYLCVCVCVCVSVLCGISVTALITSSVRVIYHVTLPRCVWGTGWAFPPFFPVFVGQCCVKPLLLHWSLRQYVW